jgi:hypothetical protein
MISVMAVFMPLFRELKETLYQWDRPFLVDDTKFRARFPGVGTDLRSAAAATAASVA